MDVRTKEFVYAFAPDCRRRQRVTRVGRTVTRFVVQLELVVGGRWQAILRFDTAHGLAHRDVLHADGRVTKTALATQDFNDALTLAEEELRWTWQFHRERFRKEHRHD